MTSARRLAVVPSARRRGKGYIRVSALMGRGEEIMSPEMQERHITDLFDRENIELLGFVTDLDKTGKYWNKRKIESMVAEIEAGDLDVIGVWKWSRVARNKLDWAMAEARVESKGGELLSATQPFERSSSGIFSRDVLIAMDAMQQREIGEGWKSAHYTRFLRGLPPNGNVPWCMRSAGQSVVVDSGRAAVVRELYRRYIAGEASYSLARWLRETGQPTTQGKPWQPYTVDRILDSEMHTGVVIYHGERRPAVFEAVIDADTFAQYQAQRRDRRRKGRRASSPYLMSGIARCGECGKAMSGSTAKGDVARLRCRYQYTAGAAHSTSASVRASDLDAMVFEWLVKVGAGDVDLNVAPIAVEVDEVGQLKRQIAEVDRKLGALTDLVVDEVISREVYLGKRAASEAARRPLAAALQAAIDRRLLASTAPMGPAAARLVERWPALGVEQSRAGLRALLSHVTVWTSPELRIDPVKTPGWSD